MMTEKRHTQMRAALKTLHDIFNEEGGERVDIILMLAGEGLSSDYGSTVHDRRRAVAILKERVRQFEEQLGAAA